jgi:ElaB/YqjD/DUF883 family membrane-anchored ribosome-binding protein
MSDDNRTPEEIQADIERTRADLSETVDTIQHRVSPESLKNQVTDQAEGAIQEIKDAAIGKLNEVIGGMGGNLEDVSSNFVARIRENPVPAALIGVGIGWLVMSSGSKERRSDDRSSFQPRYQAGEDYAYRPAGWQDTGRESGEEGGLADRARQAASSVKDKAQRLGEEVRDRAESWAEGARDKAEAWRGEAGERAEGWRREGPHLAEEARYRAQQAEEGLARMMRENPLAVGAAAVAVGAAIGLVLPRTRQEDELMGEMRDQLVDRAQEAAGKVKRVAEAAAQEAVETTREEAGRQGLTADPARAGDVAEGAAESAAESLRSAVGEAVDKGTDVVRKATDVAEKAARSARERAEEEAKKEDL